MTGFPAKSVRWTVWSWSSWRVKLATFSFSSIKDSSFGDYGLRCWLSGEARARARSGSLIGAADALGKALAEMGENFSADVDYSRGGPGVSLWRSRPVFSRSNLATGLLIFA